MSSISSACSARLTGTCSTQPWPCRSTSSAQRSGVRSVEVACRRTVEDEPPVCARSAAGVFAIAPIEEVVAALLARRGVVGDFVGGQPGRARQLLRDLVERERFLALWDHKLAGGVQRGERRLRLDGELVEREVAARERQRFTKLAPPVVDRLARSRVDEVEGDAVEVCACHLECGECFSGGMDASERLQNVVAQRLHAERHAIDSCMRDSRRSAPPRRCPGSLRA